MGWSSWWWEDMTFNPSTGFFVFLLVENGHVISRTEKRAHYCWRGILFPTKNGNICKNLNVFIDDEIVTVQLSASEIFCLSSNWDDPYSQLPLRRTRSGPAPTVHLREVSALKGDEVNDWSTAGTNSTCRFREVAALTRCTLRGSWL